MTIVEKLKKQIAVLSEDEREELIWFLMPLNGYQCEPGHDPEWLAELDRRSAELASGKDPGTPVEEVLAELDEKYGWNKYASNGSPRRNSRKPLPTSRKKKRA